MRQSTLETPTMVRTLTLFCALLLLGVANGCSSRSPSVTLKDSAGLQAEYHVETTRLTLPPGSIFPPRASEGDAGSFEAGVGQGDADFYWMCAWVDRWLATQKSDPAAATRALRALDAAPGLPVWPHWDEAGHRALLGAITDARAGQRGAMQGLSQGLGCAGPAT